VILYEQDELCFVAYEFNMIWVWCMYGMIHGLKMMNFIIGLWPMYWLVL